MLLVTPMMIPPKLFGLRLPKVCGEWPTSLMGSCTLQETTCEANFIPGNLKLPHPKLARKGWAKASSKVSSISEHVQLFRMVYDCTVGFEAEHL